MSADADDIRAAILAEHVPAPAPKKKKKTRSPEYLERKRKADRDRQRAKRAQELAEHAATLAPNDTETPATVHAEVRAEPERRPATGDGRILGVISFPRPGNAALGYPTSSEVLYARGESATLPGKYRDLATYLDAPREEVPRPATVITSLGTYAVFVTEPGEIARVSSLALADCDLPPSGLNPIKEAVSKLAPGETLDLRPPETP
jgi:hypothetical protein